MKPLLRDQESSGIDPVPPKHINPVFNARRRAFYPMYNYGIAFIASRKSDWFVKTVSDQSIILLQFMALIA